MSNFFPNISSIRIIMIVFCEMVDREKALTLSVPTPQNDQTHSNNSVFLTILWGWRLQALSLISNREHCRRFTPSQLPDPPQAGFEPTQNSSSDYIKWGCAVVIITTPNEDEDKKHGNSVQSFSNFSYNLYGTFFSLNWYW